MEYTLKITMADPAGNRTAFVEGDVRSEDFAAVGAALLREPDLRAEQAGFVLPPAKESIGRLQMMGGEFCGNAARSFGLWLGVMNGKKAGDIVPIEISGSSDLLDVLLEENGAWVSMPIPWGIRDISIPVINPQPGFPKPQRDGKLHFPAVVLEGITHVILENTPVSEALSRAVIEEAAKQTNADAAGAIFVKEEQMTPVVWVRDTDSFVWESSCGSGTLAATIWLGRDVKDGIYRKELRQPGGILKAEFKATSGKIIKAKIGGPVILEDPVRKIITI